MTGRTGAFFRNLSSQLSPQNVASAFETIRRSEERQESRRRYLKAATDFQNDINSDKELASIAKKVAKAQPTYQDSPEEFARFRGSVLSHKRNVDNINKLLGRGAILESEAKALISDSLGDPARVSSRMFSIASQAERELREKQRRNQSIDTLSSLATGDVFQNVEDIVKAVRDSNFEGDKMDLLNKLIPINAARLNRADTDSANSFISGLFKSNPNISQEAIESVVESSDLSPGAKSIVRQIAGSKAKLGEIAAIGGRAASAQKAAFETVNAERQLRNNILNFIRHNDLEDDDPKLESKVTKLMADSPRNKEKTVFPFFGKNITVGEIINEVRRQAVKNAELEAQNAAQVESNQSYIDSLPSGGKDNGKVILKPSGLNEKTSFVTPEMQIEGFLTTIGTKGATPISGMSNAEVAEITNKEGQKVSAPGFTATIDSGDVKKGSLVYASFPNPEGNPVYYSFDDGTGKHNRINIGGYLREAVTKDGGKVSKIKEALVKAINKELKSKGLTSEQRSALQHSLDVIDARTITAEAIGLTGADDINILTEKEFGFGEPDTNVDRLNTQQLEDQKEIEAQLQANDIMTEYLRYINTITRAQGL